MLRRAAVYSSKTHLRPPKGAKCSQLRKKLKVDSRNWNYIRTVRGVGYKFQPLSGE